ncbi:MAG: hypothetical protein ACFFAK_17270 [Promethearchaeota archaeon]
MPLYKIAEIFDTTPGYIKKWCTEWNIQRLDPIYWSERTVGRKKIKYN